jgi:hypothetical protein
MLKRKFKLSLISLKPISNECTSITTLRKRDRDIAQTMGIKVAQLNRWQKKIQEPSDESFVKIREFVENHILELQKFLD